LKIPRLFLHTRSSIQVCLILVTFLKQLGDVLDELQLQPVTMNFKNLWQLHVRRKNKQHKTKLSTCGTTFMLEFLYQVWKFFKDLEGSFTWNPIHRNDFEKQIVKIYNTISISEMYQVSTSVGLVSALKTYQLKALHFQVFQSLPVCSHKYRRLIKDLQSNDLIYSQIWLNLSSDDLHFFSTSSYGWLLLNFVHISLVLKLV
jgi:hypothetical protein